MNAEQKEFIATLEVGKLDVVSYLQGQYNLTESEAKELYLDYLKQQQNDLRNNRQAGQQTVNKQAVGFINKLGNYKGNFDLFTLLYRVTMVGLLVVAIVWCSKIIWGF